MIKYKIVKVFEWNTVDIITWGLQLTEDFQGLPRGHVIEFDTNKSVKTPQEAFRARFGYNQKYINQILESLAIRDQERLKNA